MKILQLMYTLLEVNDFETIYIWWAVSLIMVGVNVSVKHILAECSLCFLLEGGQTRGQII